MDRGKWTGNMDDRLSDTIRAHLKNLPSHLLEQRSAMLLKQAADELDRVGKITLLEGATFVSDELGGHIDLAGKTWRPSD